MTLMKRMYYHFDASQRFIHGTVVKDLQNAHAKVHARQSGASAEKTKPSATAIAIQQTNHAKINDWTRQFHCNDFTF